MSVPAAVDAFLIPEGNSSVVTAVWPVLAAAICLVVLSRVFAGTKCTIPGPTTWNPFGFMRALAAGRHGFVMKLHEEFGDLVAIRRGLRRMVFVRDPALIAEVVHAKGGFTKKADQWNTPFDNIASFFGKLTGQPVTPVDNLVQPMVGESFNMLDKAGWRKARRSVNPIFSPSSVAGRAGASAESVAEACKEWAAAAASSACGGVEVDMQTALHELTLDVILSIMLGWEGQARLRGPAAKPIRDAFNNAIRTCIREYAQPKAAHAFVPPLCTRDVGSSMRAAHSAVLRVVRERRADGPASWRDRVDLVSCMLHAFQGDIQDTLVASTATNLIIAGAESNASAMGTTLFLLAQRPALLSRARAEVDAVLGPRGAQGARDVPLAEDLPALRYVERCYKEALRMYPPATVVLRTTERHVKLGGHAVPANTVVGICVAAVHYDARFYPKPEVYDPERFTEEAVAARPSFTYLPFSAGMRGCPGYRMATMEALVMLSAILRQFDLAAVEDKTRLHEPLAKFVNWIPSGVHVQLTPRA